MDKLCGPLSLNSPIKCTSIYVYYGFHKLGIELTDPDDASDHNENLTTNEQSDEIPTTPHPSTPHPSTSPPHSPHSPPSTPPPHSPHSPPSTPPPPSTTTTATNEEPAADEEATVMHDDERTTDEENALNDEADTSDDEYNPEYSSDEEQTPVREYGHNKESTSDN